MKVFIGYRRDDAGGSAGRIYDRLAAHYGRSNVFRDVDAIDAGVDFVEAVETSIAVADVMLVVIGPEWLTITDDRGRVRLLEEDDHVRTEVRLALSEADLRIIPVLVDGAVMPDPDGLPSDVRDLAFRNGVEVRATRFDDDMAHVIEQIGGRRMRLLARHRWALTAVLAIAVVSLGFAARTLFRGPDPMSGDFNLAIAEFSASGDAEQPDAQQLASAVHTAVEQELSRFEAGGQLTALQVADPAAVGAVVGTDLSARAVEAERIATGINADVVLMGDLEMSGGVSRFDAEFYLSDRNLRNVEELAGAYSLGTTEINATDPVTVRREVAQVLQNQATAIAELVVGLSYFSISDYSTAYEHLTSANEAWRGEQSGREVVLQILGLTTGQLGPDRVEEARGYFESALALNPNYPRALFGLAAVEFIEARGEQCSGNEAEGPTNIPQLESVIRQFERVAAMEAPPLSFLDIHSRLEIGRVYQCLALTGQDRWADAERELNAVVASYDGSNERLRNIVAEALRSLALQDVVRGDYERALERYEEAIDLSLDRVDEAAMRGLRGDIFACHLDDPTAAEDEYEKAEEVGGVPPQRATCPA